MRILVAEDDVILRRLLQSCLEKWGYEAVLAPNGLEAWKLYQESDFPIALIDWMMPGMDGIELIRRIKASENQKYAYAIILTARAQIADLVEGMECGADDFVTKPFEREELRVRLRAGERIIGLERALAERNEELMRVRESLEKIIAEKAGDPSIA